MRSPPLRKAPDETRWPWLMLAVLVVLVTFITGAHAAVTTSARAKNEAEVAVLVADAFQNQGLGLELLRRVIDVARDEKLSSVSSEMLRDNLGMQKISKTLGFNLKSRMDSPSIKAILPL